MSRITGKRRSCQVFREKLYSRMMSLCDNLVYVGMAFSHDWDAVRRFMGQGGVGALLELGPRRRHGRLPLGWGT